MKIAKFAAALVCAAAVSASASASTFVVNFDPAAPANTNGWDFGWSAEQARTLQLPGGRKLTDDRETPPSIASPLYASRIMDVAISFKGSGVGKENEASLVLSGRASASEEYRDLFTLVGIPGSLTNLASAAIASALEAFACHQIRISYEKNPKGTLVVSAVTIVDDAIRAETPTNLRAVESVSDGGPSRSFTVSWDLPEGVSVSEYQIFSATTGGGIEDSQPVWRETFGGVPARATARQVTDASMLEWGLGGWEFDAVSQKIEGALLVGGDSDRVGTLVTPPLGQDIAAGHCLMVRACKYDTTSGGHLPVSLVSGTETNLLGTVALSSQSELLYVQQLPALAATDRLLLRPRAVDGVKNHKAVIDDIAICRGFVPEFVTTNNATSWSSTDATSMDFSVSEKGVALLFRVRSVYGEERSEWSETVRLDALAAAAASDGDAGDGASGGGDGGDGAAKADAPTNFRAGVLPDGRVRLGWTSPGGATNVRLRVWSVARRGGLADAEEGDVLWRETFAGAPATNSVVKVDGDEKLDRYTDGGAGSWDLQKSAQVSLSPDASSVKIGTGDSPGALVSRPLGVSGEGLSLVVTAKRGSGSENSGVVLRAALLSDSGRSTNEIGTAAMAREFAECAFAVPGTLAGDESLLLRSEIASPKDGRIILDDVALVRAYVPAVASTNEVALVDLGEEADEYELDAADAVRYAALCAQDASGGTSDWTETLVLDPAAIGIWYDHHLTLGRGGVSAKFDLAAIYDAKKTKLDVAHEPFRFLVDGVEQLHISNNKDVAKVTSVGVYACTNVFGRDWIVVVPRAAERKSDVKEAEMRVAIETAASVARKVAISGTFAQLAASNNVERALLFQWRWIAEGFGESEWTPFGSYATRYTSADVSPALSATVEGVAAEASLRRADGTPIPRGARVEVRVLSQRGEGQKEAPLGFCDFGVQAESAGRAFTIVVR